MNPLTHNLGAEGLDKRACLARLQTEIEIALAFLRLADAECKNGKHSHASELIDKAAVAYKAAMQHLDTISVNPTEETSRLREGARELFEAIHLSGFRYAATQG
ncbi:MAG TPA: hypothetical protein VMH80_24555 [Bryobacteraceae bacterium]|nr:hypothetical protein [Bryobacteraceae bacterium]